MNQDFTDSNWKKFLNARWAVLERLHQSNDTVHDAAFFLGYLKEQIIVVLKIDIEV